MTLSEYCYLKQQIVYSAGCCAAFEEVLNTLKDNFREDINSPRTFEGIKTIGQLIKILEIRDVLSEENVEPLKTIARKLNDFNLLKKITDYETEIQPGILCNQYANTSGKLTTNLQQSEHSNLGTNPYSLMSNKKKDRIFNTLCEEIGLFWRDLGRNLKVRECDIEEIENNNSKLYDKAMTLMKLYDEKKADPQRWFLDLCEALEKSRRKDLSKNLQAIMTMNI